MDRLRQLETFVTVVERGSFVAAARQLRLSPAGVSTAIRELESWLGAAVFTRTTRSVSLTKAGEDLSARARQIVAMLDEARASAIGGSDVPRGTLRISAPVSFGIARLGSVLAAYLEHYPEARLDLELTDRRVDLVAERIDLAIRIGEVAETALAAQPLATHRMLLCASPAYLAAHGEPAHPDDLRKHQCLIYTHRAPVAQWRFRRDGRTRTVRVSGRYDADNGIMLAAAANAGLGITLAPEFLVADALRAGTLRAIAWEWRCADAPVSAVWPAAARLGASQHALIAMLTEDEARFGQSNIAEESKL